MWAFKLYRRVFMTVLCKQMTTVRMFGNPVAYDYLVQTAFPQLFGSIYSTFPDSSDVEKPILLTVNELWTYWTSPLLVDDYYKLGYPMWSDACVSWHQLNKACFTWKRGKGHGVSFVCERGEVQNDTTQITKDFPRTPCLYHHMQDK